MNHLNIISTTEFANLAPEVDTSAYTDATLSGIVGQGSRMVEDYIGYSPFAEDISDELKESVIDSNGDLIIRPEKIPVISVSGIKLAKGSPAGDITLTLTDSTGTKYNIDFSGRYLRFPWGELSLTGNPIFTSFYDLRGRQFYTKISYRGGYEVSDLPSVFKTATALFVRDLLARSSNVAGARKITQGGITLEYSERDGKSDLVSDAERILRPYRRIG